MNFDNIETVSDLVNQNEEIKSPFETAVEALMKCGYGDSKKVVQWLLTNMVDFHKENAVRVMKGEQEGSIVAWVTDTTKLETALELIKEVE